MGLKRKSNYQTTETTKLRKLPNYGNYQTKETTKLRKLPNYGDYQTMETSKLRKLTNYGNYQTTGIKLKLPEGNNQMGTTLWELPNSNYYRNYIVEFLL